MSTVVVYLYDLSKGLAKSLSPGLLGEQIGGIWHTAVVVYNCEFFFGGEGITYCKPGKTVLGAPNSVINLGNTEIPKEIMMMQLEELGQNDFKKGSYSLMEHNCNTFSNTFSLFLTGKGIPKYILELPSRVLSSPMGMILRPFLDSMNMNPEVLEDSEESGFEGAHFIIPKQDYKSAPAGMVNNVATGSRDGATTSSAAGTGSITNIRIDSSGTSPRHEQLKISICEGLSAALKANQKYQQNNREKKNNRNHSNNTNNSNNHFNGSQMMATMKNVCSISKFKNVSENKVQNMSMETDANSKVTVSKDEIYNLIKEICTSDQGRVEAPINRLAELSLKECFHESFMEVMSNDICTLNTNYPSLTSTHQNSCAALYKMLSEINSQSYPVQHCLLQMTVNMLTSSDFLLGIHSDGSPLLHNQLVLIAVSWMSSVSSQQRLMAIKLIGVMSQYPVNTMRGQILLQAICAELFQEKTSDPYDSSPMKEWRLQGCISRLILYRSIGNLMQNNRCLSMPLQLRNLVLGDQTTSDTGRVVIEDDEEILECLSLLKTFAYRHVSGP